MFQAPVLLQILQKMRDDKHPFYPQVSVLSINCFSLQLATLNPLLLRCLFFLKVSCFALTKVLMVDGNGILHPRGINIQNFFVYLSYLVAFQAL